MYDGIAEKHLVEVKVDGNKQVIAGEVKRKNSFVYHLRTRGRITIIKTKDLKHTKVKIEKVSIKYHNKQFIY